MSDFGKLRWSIAHDPCRASHRNPLGALPAGTPVKIVLWVDDFAKPLLREAALVVGRPDRFGDGLSWQRSAMSPCDQGYVGFIDGPQDPMALFYVFYLQLSDGSSAYYVPRDDYRSTAGKLAAPDLDGDFGQAGWVPSPHHARTEVTGDFCLAGSLPGFQVTYYDPGFDTPEWMAGAVMYQIFPDRFSRQGGVRQEGLAYHKEMGRPVDLHANWNEEPAWRGGAYYDPIDFFGGTLEGIRRCLPYLASLGVQALYLNPIFEARSNHRYDTANYEAIDPLLGTEDDFRALAADAAALGIRVVLDAVLSHTGADSVYFNARDTYPQPGAWQGGHSPYRSWYDFDHPNGTAAPYRCWWGDPTLPEVDENNPSWQRFVLGDAHGDADAQAGVLPRWLAAGASGYRLDVADEIPDAVLERVRQSVKGADPQAAVIGEVWEDATNKVSYGARRTYALGRSLDSVMNYPLRSALLGFALDTVDAQQLATFLKMQKSNYPAPIYRCLMNLLSTHDVDRQRTVLALGNPIKQLPRDRQAKLLEGITADQDERAARLQRLIAGILYALPGMPCLYYGDERGLHGGGDPFCRATFPWSDGPRGDRGVDLTSFYQRLGRVRRDLPALREGDLHCCAPDVDVVCITRSFPDNAHALIAAANKSAQLKTISFDARDLGCTSAAQWSLAPIWASEPDAAVKTSHNEDGIIRLTVPPLATVYFA